MMCAINKKDIPFTVDHVGSFLRPERIKTARKDFFNGDIRKKELRHIEDKEIEKLIEKEKKVGLYGITDGEFRRTFWHWDFLEHLNGIEGYTAEHGRNQKLLAQAAPDYHIRVIDRVSFNKDHPFLNDFAFLKEKLRKDENVIAKTSIPSPNMILRQELLANDGTTKIYEIYPDLKDFYHDLAQTYKDVIKAYYEKGCRYLQFDDTNWAFLADADKRKALQEQGIDPKNIARICTEIINEALEEKPKDLTLTTHICRGNHASSWLFSGGYEPIAEELFATNYDGFFLEYDSDRAGDFSPLRYWNNKNSKIVLGLVTSKFPELESKEEIKKRIKEATEYVPLENLSISPQCGFASTEEGNRLTEQEQWEKIKLLQEVAANVWK
ncbi:MAG: 5-methyltetrahydropteroyltriglutamate--homocysteine S-methyltransferase [Tetragenococcus halophilus]|uniref:5-methyltetrahydropteroyltriglutamate-- homocysteine S-methyltransferase n=1 Tax=Tetragenococcus halophilus TaxID=51669 RepID=UPI00209B9851|nr:5-methyltetrahydropteroyltriglutamate--homocysteine S-methyltransferase [Tetragenococcus halophilus]MCO8289235.1 5-methyltetrahydropteroyltriglutamate--homocysteine S-methyltransferase [Tetragenococcus halophilus]MDN6128305.1 5-methyltetrahydropteroyltriglutamate--homocysteine S-methyltransferase [Tetragenococcus halophilus]